MSHAFPRLAKWQIVTAVVIGHMPYGLRARVPSGEIGVVDRVLISDLPIGLSEWPVLGDQLTLVSGGYTSGGQLRLSARTSDLELARTRSRHKPG
ncbi:hypothetical protein FF86_10433 [Frankia sp. CpI1-P]|nr:hypothetical protein FF86_10433 [Frankia sp. CpI1-P]